MATEPKPAVRPCVRGTAETFAFRSGDGWDYAVFIIHIAGPRYHALAIESSYGDGYAYTWSHPGECFYSFLASCDSDYLRQKLANDKQFDGQSSAREIRRHIVEYRRSGSYSREFARREFGLVPQEFDSVIEFHDWYTETKISDAHEFHDNQPGPRGRQFLGLYEKFWPAFAEEMRKRSKETESHALKED